MNRYKSATSAKPPSAGAAQKIGVDGTNFSWDELRYDDTTEEKAFFQFQIPDDYDGLNVTVRFFWKATATSGDVLWSLTHRGVGDDDVWDAAGTQSDFAVDTAQGTTEDLNEVSQVLSSPWSPGQIIQIAAIRKAGDVSDDMVGDAKLLGVGLEFSLA